MKMSAFVKGAAKGAVIVLVFCIASWGPAAGWASAARQLMFQERQPKSATVQHAIRTWEDRIGRLEREIRSMQSGPHDANDLMDKEADYVQSAVQLYSTLSGGEFPLSLRDLIDADVIREFPGSPFGNGSVEPRSLGDNLSPGAMVYAPEKDPQGRACGYWLIPIGTPDGKCDCEPLKPLPDGADVPDGALCVLECHFRK